MRRARWIVVALIVAALVSAGGYLAVDRLSRPFQGYEGEEQFVEIQPGERPAAIAETLVAAGVVRDRWTFRLALARSGAARRLQAGEYRFDRPMTAAQVVAVIEHGRVFVRSVTFPEGLTIREMGKIFEARGLGSAASFASAAREAVSLVQDIDPSARDLEGYLFPATYALSRRAGAPRARADDGGAVPRRLHAGPAGGCARARALTAAGDHARVARGEGNREARRAADRRRRVPATAEGGDAAPVRSDRHLRARAAEPVRRQPDAREPPGRFALQHLPLPGPAARSRSPRRAGPRSRPRRTPNGSTTSTSSVGTTARTSSRGRSTSTTGMCGSISRSTSGEPKTP